MAFRRKTWSGRYYKENIPCSICFLPIPVGICSPNHMLAGTIDHIIPRVKGGKDCADNRAPAHRYCNYQKAALEYISQELRQHCWTEIIRIGQFHFSAAQIRKAKARMKQHILAA